jgi:YesN/AraC family two-component response regulator
MVSKLRHKVRMKTCATYLYSRQGYLSYLLCSYDGLSFSRYMTRRRVHDAPNVQSGLLLRGTT